MKCPYVLTTVSTMQPGDFRTEHLNWDDGDENPKRELAYEFLRTDYHNQMMHDCIKDDCAAWQNGHCVRRA